MNEVSSSVNDVGTRSFFGIRTERRFLKFNCGGLGGTSFGWVVSAFCVAFFLLKCLGEIKASVEAFKSSFLGLFLDGGDGVVGSGWKRISSCTSS